MTARRDGAAAAVGGFPLPPFIDQMPRARLDFAGLSGWVVRGDAWQVVLMEADRDVSIPRHHHGAQWGVVLSGTMALTMDGETRTFARGDTHFIPAGKEHEAMLHAGWCGLYVFERGAPARQLDGA